MLAPLRRVPPVQATDVPEGICVIVQLTQQTFDSFVESAPIAIVLVTNGIEAFLNGVRDYFGKEYGADIRFGTFDWTQVAYTGWLQKRVGTLLRQQHLAPSGTRNGYYLFVEGKPVAYHRGLDTNMAAHLLGGLLAGAITNDPKDGLRSGLETSEAAAAQGVLRQFEEVLAKRPRPASRVPEAPKPPANDEPHVVLGVNKDATDDEIDAAYQKLVKQNHPDQVAHVDPALQRLANERTVAINLAREQIKKLRGR